MFRTSIFHVMEPVYRLIALRGRYSNGGRGTAKASRGVITMYWKIFFRAFYKKTRNYNNTLLKNFYDTITDIEEMVNLLSLMECQPFFTML